MYIVDQTLIFILRMYVVDQELTIVVDNVCSGPRIDHCITYVCLYVCRGPRIYVCVRQHIHSAPSIEPLDHIIVDKVYNLGWRTCGYWLALCRPGVYKLM